MSFAVLLTAGAERDLAEIRRYLGESSGAAIAEDTLDRLFAAMQALADHPVNGSYPPELVSLGIKAYRQLVVRPYRVVYRVDDAQRHAIVYVVADSRRDFQALLARRLLGA